jgi:ubiquinone/menaquinone biosynthesis C-methylase UbiE
LPFREDSFDFAIATMSFMDMPDHPRVIAESHRVIRRGGFLQFSISHPCFFTPRWKWVRDGTGAKVALEVGDYFRELNGDIDEWTFGAAPPDVRSRVKKFKTPQFTRPLSSWVNLLIDAGFTIDRVEEPRP